MLIGNSEAMSQDPSPLFPSAVLTRGLTTFRRIEFSLRKERLSIVVIEVKLLYVMAELPIMKIINKV